MSHSHTSINIHFVFAPLGRSRINTPEIRTHLGKYLKGICSNIGCTCLACYVMPDHVHMLVRLPAKLSVAECAQKVKGNSSRHLNTLPERQCRFAWQEGYGAFSCSFSALEKVSDYIHQQEEHHRVHTYDEEYRTLLQKHNIDEEVPSSTSLRTPESE